MKLQDEIAAIRKEVEMSTPMTAIDAYYQARARRLLDFTVKAIVALEDDYGAAEVLAELDKEVS